MKLSSLLKENVNVVEIYFCPEDISLDVSSFTCSWDMLPKIPTHFFKNRMDQCVMEYCHRDLVYSFDQSNDAQRVYQKNLVSDSIDNKLYSACFQEESHPTHRFPCTMEIHDKREIYRVYYKVNNRLFFVIEKENEKWTLYLRYNHATNVDMESMEVDWEQTLKTLQKAIYSKR
jgi:hypothetical protein